MRRLSTPLLHGLCRIPDVLVHAVVSEGKGCHGAGEERLQMLAHLPAKSCALISVPRVHTASVTAARSRGRGSETRRRAAPARTEPASHGRK